MLDIECRLEPTISWDLPQRPSKKEDQSKSKFRYRRENRIRDPWSWLTGTRRKTKDSSLETGIELQKIAEKVEENVPLKSSDFKLSEPVDSKNRKKVKKKKKVRSENEFVSSEDEGDTQVRHAYQSPTRELKSRHSDLSLTKMRKTDPDLSVDANILKTDRNISNDLQFYTADQNLSKAVQVESTIWSDAKVFKTDSNVLSDAKTFKTDSNVLSDAMIFKQDSNDLSDAQIFKTYSNVLSDAKLRHVASSPIDALWICSASLISTEGGRGEARTSEKARNLIENDRNSVEDDRNSDEDLDQEVEKYLKEVDKRLSVDLLEDLKVSLKI